MHAASKNDSRPSRRRPRTLTVFAAAFVAGAAAAVGINRALDIHLAQRRPQVESEPIFVALRSLAQGSPVTVWDVALRDWPKAMLPTTAMRADDSFEGCTLRHPLREGQPLLRVQLVRDDTRQARSVQPVIEPFTAPTPAAPVVRAAEPDLWTPAATEQSAATTPAAEAGIVPPPVAATGAGGVTATDVAPPEAPGSSAVAARDGHSPAGEPAPAFGGEPTLAEPQPGEPTLADTPPPADVEMESVVAARSVTAPAGDANPTAEDPPADAQAAVATDAAMAAQKPTDGPVRYLVVPERIAMQADGGLAPAAAPKRPTGGRPEIGGAPPARQPDPTVRSRATQPAGQQATTRSRAPTRGPSRSQAVPPSRQPQRQAAPPAAAAPRGFGGMFPNIAAGIDAMTGRKPREATSGFDEAVATDGPASQSR
ncbi:MAG: SAF domain-containing protein [Planctomycetia bacterium]